MRAPIQPSLSEMLAAVVEGSPSGLLVVAPDGRILFMNRRFSEMWGLPPALVGSGEAAIGTAVQVALDRVADPDDFLRVVREITTGPPRPVHEELELRDGRVLDCDGIPLYDGNGAVLGWGWYFRDVTELRRAEEEQRGLAATLQASLLPPRPPSVPGMDVATRYRPGDSRLLVGGDFFDVFRLAANDWGLVLGDVCGKGARAAALTALTRYTIRAAAVHHFSPSEVLAEVNTVLVADAEPDADDQFCAAVLARLELDVCGAWVTLASAGHPRPIVVRRAGWIDVRGQTGIPVGMFEVPATSDDRVGLGPGDALVFCTDGVTEARNGAGEMFGDEGLPEALLDRAGQPAAVIADHVLARMEAFAEGSDDDVAMLVVRVPDDAGDDALARVSAATGVPPDELALPGYPVGDGHGGIWGERPPPPREARMRLPARADSAPATRRFVAGVLASWRMPELSERDVELLATELATNATRHAATDFTVIVRYDGSVVRVEVGDGSRALPRLRHPDPDQAGGRGLLLVESLASAWGVLTTLGGKRVWFEVPAVTTAA